MSPYSKQNAPKLPAKQLAILAVARFAEPLAMTSVYPYLPEMIKSFGIPENNVAKWAGLVGSTFSISQSLFAVPWGRVSDKIGRKPSIIIGLTVTMILFIIWGTASSLGMALVVRALMGAGNGNVGIIRTVVAEMVPQKELQPRAFALMPLVWSIGSVFGPSFGGFFAQPAEQYPGLFGDSWLFNRYPFLLPNLMACVFFFISVLVATLFLRETLETKRHDRDWGLVLGEKISRPFQRGSKARHRHGHHHHLLRRQQQQQQQHSSTHRASFVDAEATAPLLPKSGATAVVVHPNSSSSSSPSPSPCSLKSSKNNNYNHNANAASTVPRMGEIFTRNVVVNLVAYTFMALHSVAADQLLPVFLNYPRQVADAHNTHLPFHFSGGYGLNANSIGMISTIYGLACGIIQFFLFPPVCSRLGTQTCFKIATILPPIVYFLIPYTALIESPAHQFAALMLLLLVKGFAVIVGFPCITILLTNSAPSIRILGTLNGFATLFSGLGRAVGPAAAGATFSWGVGRGYVLPAWWLLGVIAIGQVVPAWMIVEGEGPSRGNRGGVSDDEDEEDSDSDDGDREEEEENALLFDDDEEEDREERLVAATTGGPPDSLIVKTGRKGRLQGGGDYDDGNDEDEDDVGFSPLARMSSRASGGYGTIHNETTRRRT